MFSYPYTYTGYDPADADYLRAIADEHAARAQYQAARRAQADARARAARVRQTSAPYSSYLDEYDYDSAYGLPYAHGGYDSPRQRALLEEQRRRALHERDRQLERERLRLEEERRARSEQEQRRRQAEQERLRRLFAEEQLQRDAGNFDPFLRTFGWRSPRADDGDFASRAFERAPLRAQTSSPPRHRQSLNSHPATTQPAYTHSRAFSVPPKSPTSASHTMQSSTSTPATKPTPEPTPEKVAAAQKIQAAYRAHAALRTVSALHARFDELRSAFSPPPALDFAVPGGTVSVATAPVPLSSFACDSAEAEPEVGSRPALAYIHTNMPLHAYDEGLNRLLSALDAVESHGDVRVRTARRALACAVEREAERLERWKGAVWRLWVGREPAAPGAGEVDAFGTGEVEVPAAIAVDLEPEGVVGEVLSEPRPADTAVQQDAHREQAKEDGMTLEVVEAAEGEDADVEPPEARAFPPPVSRPPALERGDAPASPSLPLPSLSPTAHEPDVVPELVPSPDADIALDTETASDAPVTPPAFVAHPPVIVAIPAAEVDSQEPAGMEAEVQTKSGPWSLVSRGDVDDVLDML